MHTIIALHFEGQLDLVILSSWDGRQRSIFHVHVASFCCIVIIIQRDCAKTIDWYQSVKETQGSVEVTSYGQMNNINRYGSYTIGSGRKNVHTSQSQVIRLTLSGSEKRLPKNNYSLDDLSDLESKLVLITGRESSEIKHVEVFLQVSVLTSE